MILLRPRSYENVTIPAIVLRKNLLGEQCLKLLLGDPGHKKMTLHRPRP
jgi:hypothetical protein